MAHDYTAKITSSTRPELMPREEEKAFIAAIRKAKNVQEIHAALELLPLPPSDSPTEPPETLGDLWLAILQENSAGGLKDGSI
ncbi:hypothetical protein [Haliea sp.]|uniref:hypothetical protein n=1 Tax=Haliea sp. TaxID=1932666 RepID=UPI0035275E7A